MSDKLKFLEAINKRAGQEKFVELDEITRMREKDEQLFQREVRGKLFCPECGTAHLVHNRAVSPYFSTLQNDKHAEDCSKICPKMSAEEWDKYSNNFKNLNTLQRRLKALALSIDKVKIKNNPRLFYAGQDYNDDEVGKSVSDDSTRAKAIPHKKLTLPIDDEDDIGVCKMFYGKVEIEWQDAIGKYGPFMRLVLKIPDTKKRFSITMSHKLHKDFFARFQSGTTVNLAVNAVMRHNGDFYDMKIKYEQSLFMQ